MNRLFEKYSPYKGPIQGRQNGVLISMENGHRQERQAQDLEVNPLKSKHAHQLPRLGS